MPFVIVHIQEEPFMEVLGIILAKILEKENCRVTFDISAEDIVEKIDKSAMEVLYKIKDILEDYPLSDPECVKRIIKLIRGLGIPIKNPYRP